MKRLIVVSFGLLGLVFFEMSGGADFDPEASRLSRIDTPVSTEEEKFETTVFEPAQPETESVTRVTLNLASVDNVLQDREPSDSEIVVSPFPLEGTSEPIEEKPAVAFTGLLGNQTNFPILDLGTTAPQSMPVNVTPNSQVDEFIGVRQVTGNRVNLRGGPGTEFSVVDSLTRGAKVEVLQDPGNGWVELQVIGGGTVGWIADFLLSDG